MFDIDPLVKVLSNLTIFNIILIRFIKLGDFNAKSKTWWSHDITTNEGVQIESLTSTHGLHQLISDPTHVLPNSSLYIDLIITDQPNLVVDRGVHPSLYPNCHHQITYCKFSLFIEYPPPYERQVWDYKHADSSSVKKSLNT